MVFYQEKCKAEFLVSDGYDFFANGVIIAANIKIQQWFSTHKYFSYTFPSQAEIPVGINGQLSK